MKHAMVVTMIVMAMPQAEEFAAQKAKAETGFAEDGLKIGEELLKKGYGPEARFVAGMVGSRVAGAKEKAEKLAAAAKESKAKPPAGGKDAETKIVAWGKKWAGEWRRVAKAGKGGEAERLEVEAEILEAAWEHARAVALFNRRRAEAGVGTVEYDFGLAVGCQKHARYLVKNPDAAPHDEDEKLAGFSEEGRKAGKSSVIGRGGSLLGDSEIHFATMYHRKSVLTPSTRSTGMGLVRRSAQGVLTVIDVLSAKDEEGDFADYVPYPPDKSGQNFLRMCPENPMPVDEAIASKVGFPLTVSFFSDWDEIRDVRAELRELGTKVVVIECHFSSPEKPANPKAALNKGVVGLIPKAPLKPNANYRVEVSATFRDKPLVIEWTFSTGSVETPE